MGVRPPVDDGDDVTDTVTFGIAALAAHLDEAAVAFPTDAETVVAELGDPHIAYDARGRSVRLSKALEECHQREFASERELLNALHPVFEAYREGSGTGLLAQLRDLFPF